MNFGYIGLKKKIQQRLAVGASTLVSAELNTHSIWQNVQNKKQGSFRQMPNLLTNARNVVCLKPSP